MSKIHISHSLLRLPVAPSCIQTFILHARTTVTHSCFHEFHPLLLNLTNNCLYSVKTRYCLDIWRLFSNPSCYSCFTVINFICLSICKLWNAGKLIKTYLIQKNLLIVIPQILSLSYIFILFFKKVLTWHCVAQCDLQLYATKSDVEFPISTPTSQVLGLQVCTQKHIFCDPKSS